MFLVVSRFSLSVSLIGLGGFFTKFSFPLMIPRLGEFASKERGNYNNVTLGAESFQSRINLTTIIQNFTLVSLTFTMTPHPIGLPLGGLVFSLSTNSSPYTLDSLYTYLPIYLSYRYICLLSKKTFRLSIYLRSSTCRDM